MAYISEINNSESNNLWNDYSAAKEALNNQNKLQWLEVVTFSLAELINLNHIPAAFAQATLICSVVFPIFIVLGAMILRYKIDINLYSDAFVVGASIAATIFSQAYPVVRFGLPIFGMMCFYSGYLQTKGLTKERLLELSIAKLKEIIASNEPKNECALIDKIIKKESYSYIYLKSEELSQEEINRLLLLAYQHKKILCFSSWIDSSPQLKVEISYRWNQQLKSLVQISVPLNPIKIWDQVVLTATYEGFDKDCVKSFKRSVDYLIECKKQNSELEDAFINEQLICLSQTWGTKSSIALRLKPNLYLKDGNPVIISRVGELGDVTEIKKQLAEYFVSIKEEKESPNIWRSL